MCISLLLYDAHPSLLLLLTFNRDEFWDRPTQPAHFWPDEPSLLAGRDALRQGTWLGVTRSGRFALLTNVREPMNAADPTAFVKSTAAPSRGALPTNFLRSSVSPMEYLQSLPLASYFGFNLLVGDLASRQVAYVSNRDPRGPQLLQPGHYGISNGLLQEWPKVDKCRKALASALDLQQLGQAGAAAGACSGGSHEQQQQQDGEGEGGSSTAQPPPLPVEGGQGGGPEASGSDSAGELPWQVLFQTVMGDSQRVPDHQAVPLTGVGEQLDRRLSSVFVEPFELQPGTPYGTRSQTVIAVWRDGRVQQRERYVEQVREPQEQQGGGEASDVTWVWREQQHEFDLAASPLPTQQAGVTAAAREQQHEAELSEGEPAWHMFSAQQPPQQRQ